MNVNQNDLLTKINSRLSDVISVQYTEHPLEQKIATLICLANKDDYITGKGNYLAWYFVEDCGNFIHKFRAGLSLFQKAKIRWYAYRPRLLRNYSNRVNEYMQLAKDNCYLLS